MNLMRVLPPALLPLMVVLVPTVSANAAEQVIANVRVVDVVAGAVSEPRDVVIADGKILAIRSPVTAASSNTVSRYVAPGYWDMHAHVNEPEFAEAWVLPRMLAAGVTGVRDMAGDCWTRGCKDNLSFTRGLQAKTASGQLNGPRILAISSAVIGGPRVAERGMPQWAAPATAQQAYMLVDEAKRRGVDLLKTYDTMPRVAYFALLKRARAVGLPVGGHVPMSVTTTEAVRAGQLTIDHAKHPSIDCSTFSNTFHTAFAAWAAGESDRIYSSWAQNAISKNNLGGYYQSILAGYDAALCKQVIADFAASGAYYVPTLITRKFEALADEPAFLNDARLAEVPKPLLQAWTRDSSNYKKRFANAKEKQAYVDLYELSVRLVGEAHRAGVPVLIGTDTPDSYCFPGSGYHDEMLELSRAGMSNADILRAATVAAAKSLGLEKRFGTVEVGKAADLVLLNANPLDDIANAAKIAAVVVNGRVFDRKALDAM